MCGAPERSPEAAAPAHSGAKVENPKTYRRNRGTDKAGDVSMRRRDTDYVRGFLNYFLGR
jgi:hypothetical protein